MEKKGFVVKTETLYDFYYFLLHTRSFEVICNYNKSSLLGIYMLKIDSKTLEQDAKRSTPKLSSSKEADADVQIY